MAITPEELLEHTQKLIKMNDGAILIVSVNEKGECQVGHNFKNELVGAALLLSALTTYIDEDNTIETVLIASGLNVNPDNINESIKSLLRIAHHSKS
jgi:hypothetical protein